MFFLIFAALFGSVYVQAFAFPTLEKTFFIFSLNTPAPDLEKWEVSTTFYTPVAHTEHPLPQKNIEPY